MLHQSSGVTRPPGPWNVSFPLVLPNAGPMPSANAKYKITLASMHSKTEEVRDSNYELNIGITFLDGEETYGMFFINPFASGGGGPKDFGKKLADNFRRAKNQYPYLARIPMLIFREVTNETGEFIVSLPPFTSLYVDTPGFFEVLGFGSSHYMTIDNVKFKKTNVPKTAYGFSNTSDVEVFIQSREVLIGESLEDIYDLYLDESGAERVTQPRLEFRFQEGKQPIALARKRPVNKTAIMDAMSEALDVGLRILNIDSTAIYLEAVGKEYLLRSKEIPDAKLEVVITIVSQDLLDYFKLQDGIYKFPLRDARSYVLEPRDDVMDEALEEFFPVGVCCRGVGSADNWIESLGWTSLLALLIDKNTVIGDGIILDRPYQQLDVSFVGKDFKPITKKETVKFYMTLKIEPLF